MYILTQDGKNNLGIKHDGRKESQEQERCYKVISDKIDLVMDEPPENVMMQIHCATGHSHYRNIEAWGFKLSEEDIKIISGCLICKVQKYKNKPTTGFKVRSSQQIFEHLHIDTAGPIRNSAGIWYVVIILDDYSRYMKTIVSKNKWDISTLISDYLYINHAEIGRVPKKITLDKEPN